mgnify:CR=1 FL=1
MQTIEEIRKMGLGDVLCDWHYGLPDLPQGVMLSSLVIWECEGGSRFIEEQTGKVYINKFAVAVGIATNGDYIFNFSYDDRQFGVFKLTFSK